MVNQNDSFIREVNDELRSDQMKLIWQRFGIVLLVIAALIVFGTIGKVGYEYWRDSRSSGSGDAFLAALNLARENKPEEAAAALSKLEQDGFGAYPVLARMRAATVQAENGDAAGAIAAFAAIGKDTSIPAAVRNAARLRAAYLMVDTADYAAVSAEVEEIAVPGNAMRHSAREVLGLVAYRTGDFAKARDWFQQIADDAETPRNIANRARMILDLITASGKAPKAGA
ncbi:tetratricopeptide repeat protein [Ensifer soli]|uniref:tetratricopeptide repeat protein n=1 Tax=Ciceribacter sp. sgz301302 TaxID=3342379 RepID=UPI0035B8C768